MRKIHFVCWSCGHEHDFHGVIGRTAVCPECEEDAHACRNCVFYDQGSAHECREPVAERVKDKERANFCEHFKPGNPETAGRADVDDAKAKLEALFKNL